MFMCIGIRNTTLQINVCWERFWLTHFRLCHLHNRNATVLSRFTGFLRSFAHHGRWISVSDFPYPNWERSWKLSFTDVQVIGPNKRRCRAALEKKNLRGRRSWGARWCVWCCRGVDMAFGEGFANCRSWIVLLVLLFVFSFLLFFLFFSSLLGIGPRALPWATSAAHIFNF